MFKFTYKMQTELLITSEICYTRKLFLKHALYKHTIYTCQMCTAVLLLFIYSLYILAPMLHNPYLFAVRYIMLCDIMLCDIMLCNILLAIFIPRTSRVIKLNMTINVLLRQIFTRFEKKNVKHVIRNKTRTLGKNDYFSD